MYFPSFTDCNATKNRIRGATSASQLHLQHVRGVYLWCCVEHRSYVEQIHTSASRKEPNLANHDLPGQRGGEDHERYSVPHRLLGNVGMYLCDVITTALLGNFTFFSASFPPTLTPHWFSGLFWPIPGFVWSPTIVLLQIPLVVIMLSHNLILKKNGGQRARFWVIST